MSDTMFRSAPPPAPPTESLPDPEPNLVGADSSFTDITPLEGEGAVLKALGIQEDIKHLPPTEQDKAREVNSYVLGLLEAKGLEPTQGSFNQTLNSLKESMGLEEGVSPSAILDRIGGVVKAWKSVSFISDVKEKRAVLMRLARLESGKDMNKEVFKIMNQYKVWQ